MDKINEGNSISSKLGDSNSATVAAWVKPTYPNNTVNHRRTILTTGVGAYGDLSLSKLENVH